MLVVVVPRDNAITYMMSRLAHGHRLQVSNMPCRYKHSHESSQRLLDVSVLHAARRISIQWLYRELVSCCLPLVYDVYMYKATIIPIHPSQSVV